MPEPATATTDCPFTDDELAVCGTVRLPRIPTVYALYRAADDGEGGEVLGWVFDLPGQGALMVAANNRHDQVHAAGLASLGGRWADLLDAELVAVTAGSA